MESIAELRAICQTGVQDTWYGWKVARKASIYLTKLCLYTPVTGNQVTFLMTLVGIGSGCLFFFDNYWCSIAGALLVHFSFILDRVDGEVARHRKQTSRRGLFLDRMAHAVVFPLIFIGLSFGVYSRSHTPLPFVFGYLAAVFAALNHDLENLRIWGHTAAKAKDSTTSAAPSGKPSGVSGLLNRFSTLEIPDPCLPEVVMYAVLVGAILNSLYPVLIAYAILQPAKWLISFVRDVYSQK